MSKAYTVYVHAIPSPQLFKPKPSSNKQTL